MTEPEYQELKFHIQFSHISLLFKMKSQDYLGTGKKKFLSTDNVICICLSAFAADSFSKKDTFARNVNQKPTKKRQET